LFVIEAERETDGRWLAEVANLPGVLTYGDSRHDAVRKAQTLALHVLAERLKNGEFVPWIKILDDAPFKMRVGVIP